MKGEMKGKIMWFDYSQLSCISGKFNYKTLLEMPLAK